ncbi:MAG TPA: hypothetical protein DCX46_11640 [Bacteroidetes bacterium]|nr:hypothetical protein [Bacteroidota bacterium]
MRYDAGPQKDFEKSRLDLTLFQTAIDGQEYLGRQQGARLAQDLFCYVHCCSTRTRCGNAARSFLRMRWKGKGHDHARSPQECGHVAHA